MLDIGFWTVIAVPLIIAILRARSIDTRAFAFNDGATNLFASACSVVCSNVGVGTFVAIYLFTRASPLIGATIVIAYTFGLLLCAWFAPLIHRQSRDTNTFTLVDLIVVQHGSRSIWPVWLPISLIFVLRSAVQLAALTIILSEAMDLSPLVSLFIATSSVALYSIVGGYQAATSTDIVQAIIILVLVGLLLFGFSDFQAEPRPFFDLGPHAVTLLIGIALFVPLSPILAVDNWQRMATASDASTARKAFLVAAPLCAIVYGAIFWAGMLPSPTGDVLQSFRTFMPYDQTWLADMLFMIAIVSSIDTFVMPLVSSFQRLGASLATMRVAVIAIFAATAMLSWAAGDILSTVIASFSSLTVLLPCVIGAFFVSRPSTNAAWFSLNIGVATTLIATYTFPDAAALLGFATSVIVYWLWSNQGRAISI
ncbi:transporter solute:sodium symporter (SSS) family [Ahrensia sp. R2A130]|uniref:sodium:solute symporter family transporter n=1 Tax=Ahrensia sp. R2A130 TaxID=744979 RepID=UPI0001E09CC4|nr:transporter solute:sodium symporter (SSS) family [Ahrensia sp. R2A130]EFL88220.1 putative transporter, solute:sodium symporter (SSS) family [Ahrensia sp. R2A130]